MPTGTVSEGRSSSSDRKGVLRRIGEHLAREWTSALLVTSIIAIVLHQFQWLRALETYAYLAIGNRLSIAAYDPSAKFGAIVVEIDQDAFERRYRERSPLDRCELARDLTEIYATRPAVVVIDLDLSPALPLQPVSSAHAGRSTESAQEESCETRLEDVIRASASGKEACGPNLEPGSACAVRTVLLDARLPDTGSERFKSYETWTREIKANIPRGRIELANGELPVNYGVLIAPSDNSESIAAVTARLTGRKAADRIDSRQLLNGLKVLPLDCAIGPLETEQDRARCGASKPALASLLEYSHHRSPDRPTVVFFGGAYGDDDLFVTALGEIYGVEAHAIAYVSDEIRRSEIVSFLADWVMAMFFSVVIAYFWSHYFDARLSGNATIRELAKLWIIGLTASVLVAVLALSYFSFLLLQHFGFWLSPISIAIGMLIDSFVSGSVDQATHKFHALRRNLLATHQEGLHVTVQNIVVNRVEPEQTDGRLHWGGRYLPRALGGELCMLILARKPFAVALLVLWMGVWIGMLLVALRAL